MNSFSNQPRPRAARTIIFSLSALLLLLVVASLRVSPTALAAPEKTRTATVIVQFDDMDIAGRTITFEKKKLTGLAALKLTGLQVVSIDTQFGPAVCSIEGVGQPANNCFGDPEGRYWSYTYWDGNAWVGYEVGAGSSEVTNGAIEGWRWGNDFPAVLKPAPPLLAALKGLNWLGKQQSATDGGYANGASTTNTELAIGANDLKAKDWKRTATAPSLEQFQTAKAKPYARANAAQSGKLAIAISGSRSCFPKNTKLPTDYYDAGTGKYANGAGFQSFAMLGTAALAQPVPAAAVTYLKSLQQGDGGWEWEATWGTDTNTTALAMQALIAAGEPNDSAVIADAVDFLVDSQNQDGGFPYSINSVTHPSDGNSTSWAVQAILAIGGDPTEAPWQQDGTPIDYLQTLQLGNGSFEWMEGGGTNLLTTQQIIPALLGRPYVFKARAYKECK